MPASHEDEPREVVPFQISRPGDEHVKDFRPVQQPSDDTALEPGVREELSEDVELPKDSEDFVTESAVSQEPDSPKEPNPATQAKRAPTLAEKVRSQSTEK